MLDQILTQIEHSKASLSLTTDIIYGWSLEIRGPDPDHLLPLGPGHHQLLPHPAQLLQAGEGDQVGGEVLHLHTRTMLRA